MTYLIALALGILLARRLGVFRPWEEYRAALEFRSEVYLLAEETEWEERMARYREKLRPIRSRPLVYVR